MTRAQRRHVSQRGRVCRRMIRILHLLPQVVHNVPLLVLGYAVHPRRLHAALAARRTAWRALLLGMLSFIADPLVFGFTVKAAKARETAPIVAYARAALRVCALASILPSRQTR